MIVCKLEKIGSFETKLGGSDIEKKIEKKYNYTNVGNRLLNAKSP